MNYLVSGKELIELQQLTDYLKIPQFDVSKRILENIEKKSIQKIVSGEVRTITGDFINWSLNQDKGKSINLYVEEEE